MGEYEQSRLWDPPESPAAGDRSGRPRARRDRAPAAAASLPLWPSPTEAPGPVVRPVPARAERRRRAPPPAANAPADQEGVAAATPDAEAAGATTAPGRAAPGSEPAGPGRASGAGPPRPVPKAGGPRSSPRTSGPAGGGEDEAMESADEWVEGLIEEAGKRAPTLRAFVAAFPPRARWGDPWTAAWPGDAEPPAFAPAVVSYGAALREVVAGRRRLRLEGRWVDGGPGAVVAVARAALGHDAPGWEIDELIGVGD